MEEDKVLEFTIDESINNYEFIIQVSNEKSEVLWSISKDGELYLAPSLKDDPQEGAKVFWEAVTNYGNQWTVDQEALIEAQEKIKQLESTIKCMEEKYLGN